MMIPFLDKIYEYEYLLRVPSRLLVCWITKSSICTQSWLCKQGNKMWLGPSRTANRVAQGRGGGDESAVFSVVALANACPYFRRSTEGCQQELEQESPDFMTPTLSRTHVYVVCDIVVIESLCNQCLDRCTTRETLMCFPIVGVYP